MASDALYVTNEVMNLTPQRLDDAFVRNSDSQKFLPHNKIAEFVTRNTVKSAFYIEGIDDNNLVNFVLNMAPRLFLILVMVRNDQKISVLKTLNDNGLSDSSLPIMFERSSNVGKHYGYCAESDPSGSRKFYLFEEWSWEDRSNFERLQWHFLVPLFGGETFRFTFHAQRILPYLGQRPRSSSSGFFGEVSQISIHSAHIEGFTEDPSSRTISIAVKKAKDNEELYKFFDKETENLERLRLHRSPHLIKPIAAYQRGIERCLIFPWAAGGNLMNYWEQSEEHVSDSTSLKWIISQFVGLCSALEELHVSNCRHGDLKPENILWFKGGNDTQTLQIADMGLATFHEKEEHTRLRNVKTSTPSGTSRYEPPEMDANRDSDEARSRAYDIWSMGCILFELLIRLIYGHMVLKAFQRKTQYFWAKQEPAKYSIHSETWLNTSFFWFLYRTSTEAKPDVEKLQAVFT
ncbi:kinase-like domain-containing protein [Camillea tinctor]|nr:kinase-like domain-containing protein [Camillea tinctor]